MSFYETKRLKRRKRNVHFIGHSLATFEELSSETFLYHWPDVPTLSFFCFCYPPGLCFFPADLLVTASEKRMLSPELILEVFNTIDSDRDTW